MSRKSFFNKNRVLPVLVLVSIFVLLNIFQKDVRNFFYTISLPIQETFWKTGGGTVNFWETISGLKTIKEESEKLKLRDLELLAENARLKELKIENDFLRKALDLGLEKEFKLILTQVIAKDTSQDSILINKGFADGIAEGDSVITEQKILLGKVKEVQKNFSWVMLISHKESSFNAKLENESDEAVTGMVKGEGNFGLLLDLVPREKQLREGDILVTTSWGGIFPQGILVGVVKEIRKNDVDPFQKITIEPFFDLQKVNNLFVVTEQND
ncbi:MAG: rod shape-determining protein MreC [bacterium]